MKIDEITIKLCEIDSWDEMEVFLNLESNIMKAIIKTLLFLLTVVLLSQCEKDDPQVNIPDDNFLNALIELGVDTNGDSIISPLEAEMITSLDVRYKSISDLTGIEAFVNLETLNCYINQLTSLDVSNNTALIRLECSCNQLTILDFSNNTALINLYCSWNQLTSLDVSNNTKLSNLGCRDNQLTSLDVSNNTALEVLWCYSNQLTTLDVSNNTALRVLYCYSNQLTTLDVSNNTALETLYCYSNQLTSLDVSNNTALIRLECSFCELTTLNISNNTALTFIYLNDMPSLNKVCVWEMPFPPDGVDVETTNSPNVYFTTECSGGN